MMDIPELIPVEVLNAELDRLNQEGSADSFTRQACLSEEVLRRAERITGLPRDVLGRELEQEVRFSANSVAVLEEMVLHLRVIESMNLGSTFRGLVPWMASAAV